LRRYNKAQQYLDGISGDVPTPHEGLHAFIGPAVSETGILAGWCRLTVSNPVLKAPMVSALEGGAD